MKKAETWGNPYTSHGNVFCEGMGRALHFTRVKGKTAREERRELERLAKKHNLGASFVEHGLREYLK